MEYEYKQYKIVITERCGDTVITESKYTDILDDAREIFESSKSKPNVVDIRLWSKNLELERYVKEKNIQ